MTAKSINISAQLWAHLVKASILVCVCLIIGFIISFFSPYVTLDLDPSDRLEFWVILCLVGGLGIFIVDLIFSYFVKEAPKHIKGFIQSLGGTIAVLIPLYWLYDPTEIPSFGTSFLFVWLVIILILAGSTLAHNFFKPQPGSTTSSTQPDLLVTIENEKLPAKILNRLPVNLQNSELYALSAEDHYVRVYTSKGDNIILMRLSDAMTETGSFEGLQTHRSWWVAKAAIDKITPKGRTAEIILKNEITVPVSRNALKTVRDAGWL